MKVIYFISLIFIISCNVEKQKNQKKEKNTFNIDYKELFKIALQKNSTQPNYIVFRAKNLNTNEIKEICCVSTDLIGAISLELKIGIKKFEDYIFIKKYILDRSDSIFEFKEILALKNINFDEYPGYEIVLEEATRLNTVSYYLKYKNNNIKGEIIFENDTGYEQEMFAHIMFKLGIITSRDCLAGNILLFGCAQNPSVPNLQ